jgi:hypothetical protein
MTVATETLNYSNEKEATVHLLALLEDDFLVCDEVEMTPNDKEIGDRFRIDLIATLKAERDFLVGFELKKGFRRPNEYVSAFKQAHDYRDAVIDDPRFPDLQHRRLAAIFVFPNWQGNDHEDPSYKGHAAGIEMLAGKFRTGSAGLSKSHGLTLFIGQNRVWSQTAGFHKNWRNNLFGKRQVGSGRKQDSY